MIHKKHRADKGAQPHLPHQALPEELHSHYTILPVLSDKKRYLSLLLLADPSEAMIDRYLPDGDMYALMAEGDAVCVAVVVRLADGLCELKNLATQEAYQGRGYGSAMVRYLWSRYRTVCHTMQVGTSEAGVAFYARLGFVPSHTMPHFFTDNYPAPIYENGRQCVDMQYLKKAL